MLSVTTPPPSRSSHQIQLASSAACAALLPKRHSCHGRHSALAFCISTTVLLARYDANPASPWPGFLRSQRPIFVGTKSVLRARYAGHAPARSARTASPSTPISTGSRPSCPRCGRSDVSSAAAAAGGASRAYSSASHAISSSCASRPIASRAISGPQPSSSSPSGPAVGTSGGAPSSSAIAASWGAV
ncbi:MAG: hypothetical protein J3K34DRAFT_400612 [Monoraphidium minutum]|nr:MAG: hypothetical protein J3K34DRAFT_400612 [Monoraphidium minutum]